MIANRARKHWLTILVALGETFLGHVKHLELSFYSLYTKAYTGWDLLVSFKNGSAELRFFRLVLTSPNFEIFSEAIYRSCIIEQFSR